MSGGPYRMADPRPCATCGNPFRPRLEQLARGVGRFCSYRCGGKFAGSQAYRGKTSDGRPSEPFMLDGQMACRVPISPEGETLIDAGDRDLIGRYLWRRHSGGYALASSPQGNVYLHRLLMDPPEGLEVDHRNGDRLDNRRSNLRLVTHLENCWNTRRVRSRSHTGVQCVSLTKAGRYYVRISRNRQVWRKGSFATLEEAARAAAGWRAELVAQIGQAARAAAKPQSVVGAGEQG